MPSNRPDVILPLILGLMKLSPNTILDVGCGFGRLGFLVREYLEVWKHRYLPEDWRIRVDAIEIFPYYIQEWHHIFYNNIFLGNALEILPGLSLYQVIVLSDILEHMEKEQGAVLLKLSKEKATKAVALSTPAFFRPQDAWFGNEHEKHICAWAEEELNEAGFEVEKFGNQFVGFWRRGQ